MSAFSDYLESGLGDLLLRGQTYTSGAVYFALYTSDPTDADSGVEVSDSAYVRPQAHLSVVSDGFTNAGGGVFTNAQAVAFPAIADTQIVVTHWALFDAATVGNMLFHGSLTASKTLDPADVLNLPVASVSITLA